MRVGESLSENLKAKRDSVLLFDFRAQRSSKDGAREAVFRGDEKYVRESGS